MDYYQQSLELHEKYKGKIEAKSKVRLETEEDLSVAYTPGVAQPCLEIYKNPQEVYRYTSKGSTIAVVSDGSAVLGLGNIGAKAAIPVMEGKAILFKQFGGVNAVPICLETQDVDEIVTVIKAISPTFGGINLEDISAPRCFEVEEKLQALVDIPVFHDDQHGTAAVVSAALINAARFLGRSFSELKVTINGAGAAGTSIAKMLISLGVKNILVCDSKGVISPVRSDLARYKRELLAVTNPDAIFGVLTDAVKDRDVFIGVSAAKVLTPKMVKSMNKAPIVFAMANPEPEIMPELAKAAGVAVMGTGRSDFPNQINNLLIFPGIFKGALAAGAKRITEQMKIAAVHALAQTLRDEELRADYVIPSVLDRGVADKVAEAVAQAWR